MLLNLEVKSQSADTWIWLHEVTAELDSSLKIDPTDIRLIRSRTVATEKKRGGFHLSIDRSTIHECRVGILCVCVCVSRLGS